MGRQGTAGHASVDARLHSPQAAASLDYSPCCCHPGMKGIEQLYRLGHVTQNIAIMI